jgi:ribosome-binding protein aMBF1 (putative translation factor)
MEKAKKARLEKQGWRVSGAEAFLGLDDAEASMIELKLALSDALRQRRLAKGVTQSELAKKLGSSQSRVAKMEASDPSVTMDLLVRAHFALGATPRDLAKAIQKATQAA